MAHIAEDRKGRDISIREVDQLVDYADYLIFVTGANRRQVQAIADSIEGEMREEGRRPKLEGYETGWWVLLDLGDVLIHILQPEAREFYDFDALWADAPAVKLPPPRTRDLKAAP